jgi:hypothetical protein
MGEGIIAPAALSLHAAFPGCTTRRPFCGLRFASGIARQRAIWPENSSPRFLLLFLLS